MTEKKVQVIRLIMLMSLAAGICYEAGFFTMVAFLITWLALELRKPRRQAKRPPSVLIVGNMPTTKHQQQHMIYPIEKYLN